MIKYALICENGHQFEGWFRNSSDFDEQAAGDLLECPVCGASEVRKAIMAPAVSTGGSDRARRVAEVMAEASQRARDYVEKNFDYVGGRFPEEARKIHYGETKERGIYGEATGAEVRELIDEGVSVAPVPQAAKPAAAKDEAGPARIAPPAGKSKKPPKN